MVHTNMSMPNRLETADRLAATQLASERDFWRNEAERLAAELENIPRAVKRYGFIEVPDGSETLTLVREPSEAAEPTAAD